MSSAQKLQPPRTATSPRPGGYHAVTPWIVTPDTAAVFRFIEEAFGGRNAHLMHDDNGTVVHAEITIGDSVVMGFDTRPDWPLTPALLRLYVDDADAAFDRAIAAGATVVTRVTHLAFGDRVGRVRDPAGNIWWLQTHVEDVATHEMERRQSDPRFNEAMAYVQNSLIEELAKSTG